MKGLILIFSVMFFFNGCICNKMKSLYIYSLDKTQCITIFNCDTFRYIANGKQKRISSSNYIKLDIRNIDPLGDALHVCWKTGGKWDIVVHNSIIIESKLDTSMFNFKTTLPLDDQGIPTEKKFRQKNCAIFDFYRMRLSPNEGAIIEYP
jgi:hypothetical protein